ncbi:DinB family protein [Streptomyces sp. NPDC048172]|uniref:DinB family protein n=1 Tax=Streptomyces sp. NPDC048172 TaxID=3365505 RepID=UPI00371E4248
MSTGTGTGTGPSPTPSPHTRFRPRARDAGPPSSEPGEKATLCAFLDYLRDSLAGKVAGAPEPQVRTGGVPSGTSLLGLLKHLTSVERFYFLGEEAERWPATLRPSAEDTVDGLLDAYRTAVERANEVIDACQDLDLPAPRPPRRGGPGPSMRWVLVHMIEETGRHAGHADILREQIDGSTGR